ncbi:hypothetical protein FJR48_08465 [Sulfurimonas lithotrophica]|uniref:Uncharacterized protein n=1 Tax=Sulfurimonas lithotrophica TaxID=2590022 RepID=A0A5P8P227_9BACT|nr:hypothetical protein [Sulfurimonas lithotrophica]QFR49759.1 hypothetical protein FJR48_08465 [Sulfurimonas lithotrophica]
MTAFQSLVNIINDNHDLIDFEYKDIKDLTVINGKLFSDIIKQVKLLQDRSINKKEFIKKAVRTAFELEDQDLVLIKKEQIVIKIIQNIKRDTTERRFNGYSEDELLKLYNEYFDKTTLETFIKNISYEVFKYLFIRKQVTNDFYEKNIYSIVQNYIAKALIDFEDKNAEFRKGFAGYIFRINFVEVFSHISDQILESISYRDEYLMNWIKYYNGQVIIKHNKRYEAPSIVNESGQKYNPSALFGTIAMWFKTRDKIILLKKRFKEVNKNLEKLKIDNLSPIEYKDELIQERQEIEKYIYETNEKIKDLLEKRRINKDEETLYDINDEIQELRLDIKEDKREIDDLNAHIANIDTISTKRLEEDKARIKKDIAREEKALKQNKKVYQSIQSALVKALTSKRKPI